MILVKETYIHNRLEFNETERSVLKTAYEIIQKVKNSNIHSPGAEDSYLNEQCDNILSGLSELGNDYSNSYADEE